MSAFDKSPSYYQHLDITDPTPYENDDESEDDFICPICRRAIRYGEDAVMFSHDSLVEPIAAHRGCLTRSADDRFLGYEAFCAVMEDLGFEIEEGET